MTISVGCSCKYLGSQDDLYISIIMFYFEYFLATGEKVLRALGTNVFK